MFVQFTFKSIILMMMMTMTTRMTMCRIEAFDMFVFVLLICMLEWTEIACDLLFMTMPWKNITVNIWAMYAISTSMANNHKNHNYYRTFLHYSNHKHETSTSFNDIHLDNVI